MYSLRPRRTESTAYSTELGAEVSGSASRNKKAELPTRNICSAFEELRETRDWKQREAGTRHEWERGWSFIQEFFADVPPRKVSFQMVDRWYYRILDEHGTDAAWRAMKIWRALWGYMAVMHLCDADKDPSLKLRRRQQNSRTEYWTDQEVDQLIEGATRLNMTAIACIISIAWDTIFQPGDTRTLKRRELFIVGSDWIIDRGRVKNGTKVIGRLRDRSRRLLESYLRTLGTTLEPDALIFRTRGYQTSTKGGRPRAPSPYTKNTLAKDFRILRTAVFGSDDNRKLMDLRRSGTMEAIAGDATAEQIGQTLGNDFKNSKKLQTTYAPNHLASVKKVEEARAKGRKALAPADHQFKPLTFDWEGGSEENAPNEDVRGWTRTLRELGFESSPPNRKVETAVENN